MGNRTKEELFDPANALTQKRQREFDALSRLWKDIGAQNQITQYRYDAQGNRKQITDPLQHSANYGFDALNRLIQTTDPLNGLSQQEHDALDQITQVPTLGTSPLPTYIMYINDGVIRHMVDEVGEGCNCLSSKLGCLGCCG